ncbi:MAG: hypothetical protein MUC49_22655 [Raineya sp.]|jgi:hypothetical protein|nr:hypothetical protein [Raineya sp.]
MELLIKLIKKQFYHFNKHNKTKLEQFLKNEDVWKLFPFIQFENDSGTYMLLGTIHKFCYGFFDGKKTRKITYLKNYVVFLDEFDFLENEILKAIATEEPLNNPLIFIKIFLERFKKLGDNLWKQDGAEPIRKDLQRVYNDILNINKKQNIHLHELEDFTFDEVGKQKLVVFQTKRTIPNRNFYLKIQENSWEISYKKDKGTLDPNKLFSLIYQKKQEILNILKKGEEKYPKVVGYIIHEVWDIKNDYEESAYRRYIENITFLQQAKTSNSPLTDFNYSTGFSLIEMENSDSSMDPQKANLNFIEIDSSPELFIKDLSDKNLVFALSATFDIDRVVKSFNQDWLKQQVNFIEPTQEDIELVKRIKNKKKITRGTTVEFAPNTIIQDDENFWKNILNDLSDFKFFDDVAKEDDNGNRKERLSKLLGCLDWIATKSKNKHHLVFLTSFEHFKKLLEGSKIEDFIYEKVKNKISLNILSGGLKSYQISWNTIKINIILLNAEEAKKIEEDKTLFNQIINDPNVDKAILITQYQTASNGINLGYEVEELSDGVFKSVSKDFTGIHLIEKPYYWFDTQNNTETKKINFWYLWKLYDKQLLNKGRFKYLLEKSDNDTLNHVYQSLSDALYNNLAIFYQALGRIERRWESVPLVEVTLGDDVVKIFLDFFKNHEHKEVFQRRKPLLATTITLIQEKLHEHIDDLFLYLEDEEKQQISSENLNSKAIIQKLLEEIEKVKSGKYHLYPDKAKEIINIWQKIRHFTLERNLEAVIDVEFNKNLFKGDKIYFNKSFCFYKDGHLYENKYHLDEKTYTVYSKKQIVIENCYPVDRNHAYKFISKNTVIKKYFDTNCFALKNSPNEKYIFTPYIEQAILYGAIGEESIKALLEHHKIFLEEASQDLFEVFDAKVCDLPLYIDFKNFSSHTIDKFAIDKTDVLYDEDFNAQTFLQKIVKKIHLIEKTLGSSDAKYIVINLIDYNDSFQNNLLDISLNKVSTLKEAKIIVVPGIIHKNKPNKITPNAQQIIEYIKSELKRI